MARGLEVSGGWSGLSKGSSAAAGPANAENTSIQHKRVSISRVLSMRREFHMQDGHRQLVSNAIKTGASPQVVQSLHEQLAPSSNHSVVSHLDDMDKLRSL